MHYFKNIALKHFPIIFFILFALLFVKGLKPGNERMFMVHDSTQPIRIEQFIVNLENLKIPPRIAPEMSFRMGWPLFTMYAPLAYWVASFVYYATRLPIVDVLRLTYLLGLLCAYVGSYFFLRRHFSLSASLLGAAIYATSTYLSVNIFIRGAMAELWFIAVLPLALLGINMAGSATALRYERLLGTIFIAILLLSHNSLAPLSLPLLIIYGLMQPKKSISFISIIIGLLLTSTFWIPLVFENKFTHAFDIATKIKPEGHLLCAWQLWNSAWGYGASTDGCIGDGMSFNVGKPQLAIYICSVVFALLFFIKNRSKVRNHILPIFFLLYSAITLFMTLNESEFIWKLFSSQLALIQFPWRFIGLSLIGIAFIISWAANRIENSTKERVVVEMIIKLAFVTLSVVVLLYQSRMFINDQNTTDVDSYEGMFYSSGAKYAGMSYGYIELLPASVENSEYQKYSSYKYPRIYPSFFADENTPPVTTDNKNVKVLKNDPFYREIAFDGSGLDAYANIHAYPNWHIDVNGDIMSSWDYYVAKLTDSMGRPIIKTTQGKSYNIKIIYKQTLIEVISNTLSISTFVLYLLYSMIEHEKSRAMPRFLKNMRIFQRYLLDKDRINKY